MTPEKQKIAIAELSPNLVYKGGKSGEYYMSHDTDDDIKFDPLNNLNTMHKAWMWQPSDIRISMHQILMDIVNRDFPKDRDGYGIRENLHLEHWVILTFEATAAQRAEAFLKTFGKWED